MAAITSRTSADGAAHATVCELNELIKAIDRRLPQIERAGEAAIALMAQQLRADAVKRIAELERLAHGS